MSDRPCKVAVLASGSGTNFRAIADACRSDKIPAQVVCLISDKADAGAHDIATALGIASHTLSIETKKAGLSVEVEEEIIGLCRQYEVDLIALAGFMRILKGPLLTAYEGRIMNIHPSLLPSFKGLHAVRQALEYGVKTTGCTVHFVDRSIDGGAIILQAAVPISESDTEDSLLAKVHAEEYRIYVAAVGLFARNRLRVEERRVRIVDPVTPDKR